jgi:transcriptional regulator with XRE-family HTH domain
LSTVPQHRPRAALAAAVLGARLRGEPGYSIAQRAGISPAFLSMVVHGRERPSLTTAERLAAVLGQSVAQLFPGEELE